MADANSTWSKIAGTLHIHTYYLGIILVLFLVGHSWLAEHDARLKADAVVKAAQTQINSLQQTIADRDKQAQQTVAPTIKIIHDTVTVPQAIQNIPDVVVKPLQAPIVPAPNNAMLIPEPDVIPIFDQLADDKVCRVLLTTANADALDQKKIIGEKDDQIVALKKKPGFWKRIGGVAKAVGIGIGIGVIAAKYL